MTDIAALGFSVDSSGIVKADETLDRLAQSSDRAGKAADDLGRKTNTSSAGASKLAQEAKRVADNLNMAGAATSAAVGATNSAGKEWVRASSAAGQLRMAELEAAKSAEQMAASTKGVGVAASQMARDAQQSAAGLNVVTKGTNAQRAGFQQLGMQIGDISTMYALGAKPTQIFASQIGQVTQAVQLATGGTSKFAAFLGGPWGIALVIAVQALGPLIAKLFETKDAMDEVGNAATTALAKLRTALAQTTAVSDAMTENTRNFATSTAALAKTQRELNDLQAAANELTGKAFSGEIVNGLNQRIAQLEKRRDVQKEAVDQVKRDIEETRTLATKVIPIQTANEERLGAARRTTARATNALSAAEREAAKIARELQREREQQIGSINSYIERLERQSAEFGKSAKEIRAMEFDAFKQLAVNLGLSADEMERLNLAFGRLENNIGTKELADDLAKATEFSDGWRKSIEDEIALLGLVGPARAKAALALEETAFKAAATEAKIADVNHEWAEYYRWNLELLNQKSALERDLEAADALAHALSNLPGIGGDLFRILNSYNPIAAMLGTGGIAGIAGTLLGGSDPLLRIGDQFTRAIERTFPRLNEDLAENIGQTLAGVFQGAGIGGAVHSVAGGSATGSMVGGALGQVAGEKLLSKGLESLAKGLGDFAGPLGSIAGALLGGVLGGVFGSTKRGGATLGAGGITGTWGNSDQRIQASSGIANNALSALTQLADALNVTLGQFSSSISVREGNLRFDPTGSGISKTSKGAINFGQDEAGLLKAVIEDAIRDGAFEGLSQGFKDYLSSGDVEKRLQDVLSLKGAQSELASLRDPQAFALGQLDTQFAELRRIAEATGEGLADIEELYGLKRKEIVERYSDDIVNAEEVLRQQRALEIQIMELSGDAQGALNAARALEKEQVDASLIPLLDRRNALQDEAAEASKAAQAAADLAAQQKAIADERYNLETRLLELQGKTNELRNRDRMALNESNRALQDQIWALEEAAQAAADYAAKVQAINAERYSIETRILELQGNTSALKARELLTVDEANRKTLIRLWQLQEEAETAANLAALEKAIADERYGLMTQYLQLIGDEAALHERQLATLNPANTALQEQIWALQAQKAAAEEAAQAAAQEAARLADVAKARRALQIEIAGLIDAELAIKMQREDERAAIDATLLPLLERKYALQDEAKALEEAARAAQEMAAQAQAIADERYGLETRLLQLQGNTAALRERELAALHPTNRAILSQIFALEDLQAANDNAAAAEQNRTAAINAARDAVSAAYNREVSALQGVIDKFGRFSEAIQDFRDNLFANDNGPAGYAGAFDRFGRVSRQAAAGSEYGLENFTGAANAFLDASLRNSRSAVDYARDVARARAAADAAIMGANGRVNDAQAQIDLLTQQVEGIIDLNENIQSVQEAVADFHMAQANDLFPTVNETLEEGFSEMSDSQEKMIDELKSGNADMRQVMVGMLIALNSMERKLSAAIQDDTIRVSNDSSRPVYTSAA